MRFRDQAIAFVTLMLLIPGRYSLAADPFAELEKEAPSKSSNSNQDGSRKRANSFNDWRQKQNAKHEAYNKELLAEWDTYRGIAVEEQKRFEGRAGQQWDDPVTSTRKEWVEYSPDLKERSRVDFEKETIELDIEMKNGGKVDPRGLRRRLKKLIGKNRAQAFSDDPVLSAVERRSKKEVKLLETAPIKAEPLLTAYLTGKLKTSGAEVDAIVDHMMATMKQSVVEDSKGRQIQTVVVPLVAPQSVLAKAPAAPDGKGASAPAGLPRKATTLWADIDNFANDHRVPRALVLAIIETESAFNPQAKSGVPAYGLMQIVPGSAGMDATERLFGRGKGRILAPSYLYDPEKNIQIGAIYLNILLYSYLEGIDDPLSRLYCSVAAYNTGAGNVSRAFTNSTRIRKAFPEINKLSPQQVYDRLIKKLPHDETKDYLKRVSKRILKYEGLGV